MGGATGYAGWATAYRAISAQSNPDMSIFCPATVQKSERHTFHLEAADRADIAQPDNLDLAAAGQDCHRHPSITHRWQLASSSAAGCSRPGRNQQVSRRFCLLIN